MITFLRKPDLGEHGMTLIGKGKSAKVRARGGKYIAVILLLLSCLIAYGLGMLSKSSTIENGGLVVMPEDLQIGEVYENETIPWHLRIMNPTSKDMHIPGFYVSCGCTKIVPDNVLVPAGGKADLQLTINLSKAIPQGKPETGADFEVVIAPAIQGTTSRPKGWILQGKVRYAVLLSTRRLDFGRSIVRGQVTPGKKVMVTAQVPLRELIATGDPNRVVVRTIAVLGKEGVYEIGVTPCGSLPVGPFSLVVQVQAISRDGIPLPRVSVPVTGTVLDKVQIVPTALPLGAHRLGEKVTETVALQSLCGKKWELQGIEVEEGAGTEVVPLGKRVDGSVFRIVQQIRGMKQQRSTINFRVRLEDGEPVEGKLELSYYGLSE
jgi:hypothetical protein